jgi:hypothetical protein
MNTCPSKKKSYLTEVIAEEALLDAWGTYDYKNNGPIAIYRCDMCGAYHFTSKGEMNKRLAEHIESGQLKRHAQASKWIEKFKQKKR